MRLPQRSVVVAQRSSSDTYVISGPIVTHGARERQRTRAAPRSGLASLDRVRWRYLYLELSLRRSGASSLAEVTRLVERMTGRAPRVVYEEPVAPDASHMDVILAAG